MNTRTFIAVSTLIFAFIAVLQLIRILYEWDVSISDWHLPIWVSVVAIVVAGLMSFAGVVLLRRAAGRADA